MAKMNELATKVYESLKSNPATFDMASPRYCIAGEAHFIATGERSSEWGSTVTADALGLPDDSIFWDGKIFRKTTPEIAEIFKARVEGTEVQELDVDADAELEPEEPEPAIEPDADDWDDDDYDTYATAYTPFDEDDVDDGARNDEDDDEEDDQ